MAEEAPTVDLICVTVGKRLRVRILTDGYFTYANCQFPRDIRVDGQRYRVPVCSVRLVSSRGKYFYSIAPKSSISIVNDYVPLEDDLKIFEDQDTAECAICLSAPKQSVFVPCGHYYCCEPCTLSLTKCPICRTNVTKVIRKTDMDV